MPTAPSRTMLQTMLAAARHEVAPRTDADLLAAFAARQDQAAFAELVRRHGRLVLGVAHRLIGERTAAEDVFQAAFLLLARKAGGGGWGPTVGPWLFETARRLGLKARSRLQRRETAPLTVDVAGPTTDPAAGLAWGEVRVAIDDALSQLPAHLRDPLVLCYLEGLTQDETAALLGCSVAAVKGRVTRGRERLREILGRRGLTLSAGLSGALVAEAGVSGSLVAATAQAAVAARAAGGVSLGTLTLGALGLLLTTVFAASFLSPAAPTAAPAVAATAPAVDRHGDPLPAGALARLGSSRMMGVQIPTWAAFSPDGKKLVVAGHFGFTVWDAATGKKLSDRNRGYPSWSTQVGWRADGVGVALIRLPDGSHYVTAFTDVNETIPDPPRAGGQAGRPGPDGLSFNALSPDGKQVVVVPAPDDKQFSIDVLTATPGRTVDGQRKVGTLGPFPGPCREIRYTTGGKLYYLSGPWQAKAEWQLHEIDIDKNRVARSTTIQGPGFCVWRYMANLSPDARLVSFAAQTQLGTNLHEPLLRVWDLAAGKQLHAFPFKEYGYGTGHAITPDGTRLIVSTYDRYFQIWDLTTGKEVANSEAIRPHVGVPAITVAVSPDGKRFVTTRSDGLIDFWETATGKPVFPLDSHTQKIEAVAVSNDGKLAATLGEDEVVRVYDVADGTPRSAAAAPRKRLGQYPDFTVRPLAFTPAGDGVLLTAAGNLTLIDPLTGKSIELPQPLRKRAEFVGGFSADGRTLATFGRDTVTLWDWPGCTVRATVTVPLAKDKKPNFPGKGEVVVVFKVALSRTGDRVFTNSVRRIADQPEEGGYHHTNDVWDAHTGKLLHRFDRPDTEYPPAAFAADGRTLYLGGHGYDGPSGRRRADALTAWDPVTGSLLRRFIDPPPARADMHDKFRSRNVVALALSPDGRLLAAAEPVAAAVDVLVYETASGRILKKLAGHTRQVTGLAFTPDGRRLVSVSEDQTGLVWDVTLPTLVDTRGGTVAEAWDRLAAADPTLGMIAVATLTAAPAEAVALLKAKLRPAPVPTAADLDRVVKQLDADALAERAKAGAELERFGPNAVAGMRQRLKAATSAEVRQRLTLFLRAYDDEPSSPYYLRSVRGVAVLAAIDTAAARALLRDLANGPADDRLTLAAKDEVRRAAKK